MLGILNGIKEWYLGLSSNVKMLVIGLAIGFIFGGCTCRNWRKAVIEGGAPEAYSFGWLDEPEHVDQVVRTFKSPYFSDSANGLMLSTEDKDAFLWKYYEQVHGHPWKAHDQNGTGCCVGEGFAAGVEILTAVGIVVDGNSHEYQDISAAAVYALSREVGDFLGNQDGSTGADAAKALQDLGVVSCKDAGDTNGVDGTAKTHASLAKQWGRSGLPAALKQIAVKHRVKTVSRVRSAEEVRVALTNGYPVPICSTVGFEPFRRDSDGFCKPGGTWPHCMCIVGYRADKRAFLVLQSWGETMPPGPKTLGQPNCSFWITWDACNRITKTGECYAISNFDGYPAQRLPFFIHHTAPDIFRGKSIFLCKTMDIFRKAEPQVGLAF